MRPLLSFGHSSSSRGFISCLWRPGIPLSSCLSIVVGIPSCDKPRSPWIRVPFIKRCQCTYLRIYSLMRHIRHNFHGCLEVVKIKSWERTLRAIACPMPALTRIASASFMKKCVCSEHLLFLHACKYVSGLSRVETFVTLDKYCVMLYLLTSYWLYYCIFSNKDVYSSRMWLCLREPRK